MLGLVQSIAFHACLLLTTKGWSALRKGGLRREEIRVMTGLCVFGGMGDLIVGAGLGTKGDDGRPVIVHAVFRLTVLGYAAVAVLSAWQKACKVSRSLTWTDANSQENLLASPMLNNQRSRVQSQVDLMQANACLLSVMLFTSVVSWAAAVKWPEWPLSPVLCNELPVVLLYLFIVGCIKADLL